MLTPTLRNGTDQRCVIGGGFLHFYGMVVGCDIIRAMNKQLHFTPQASEFLTEQSAAVQKAFFEKLKKLSDDGLLREPDAKKIAPNLFEIRVKVTRMQYRLFYCYVDPNGIWVLSGFVKKTQRTPPNEIRKAQTIRKEVE